MFRDISITFGIATKQRAPDEQYPVHEPVV